MAEKEHSPMKLSRRDFLKFSIPATTGLLVLGGAPSVAARPLEPTSGPPELKGKALLYDITRCRGVSCRACTNGCRIWNKQDKKPTNQKELDPLAFLTWTAINDNPSGEGPFRKHHYFKAQCRHCAKASCVGACPTGAMHYQGDYVIVDEKWCIGCGYCVEACPYGVPHMGQPRTVVAKCRFCIDKLQSKDPKINGIDVGGYITTACEERCPIRPIKALRFGDRAKLIETANKEIAEHHAKGRKDVHLYGEHELGGTQMLMILDQPNEFFGLPSGAGLKFGQISPRAPRFASEDVPTRWGSGIATSAALAVMPFWWLFKRKKKMEADQQSGVQGEVK